MISKKAQTEIIGVVLIVIILVIAGFFMIGLKMRNSNNSDLGSFEDPELAQSFLNALMDTKTERNILVKDAIEDCYSERNDLCGQTDCCSYARAVMVNALSATLDDWQKSYRLQVRRGSEKLINDIPEIGLCNDFSEKEQPGTYPIPSRPEPIIVKLEICK